MGHGIVFDRSCRWHMRAIWLVGRFEQNRGLRGGLIGMFSFVSAAMFGAEGGQSASREFEFQPYHATIEAGPAEVTFQPARLDGESGIYLTLPADPQTVPTLTAVYFELASDGRDFSIREETDGKVRYVSTANRDYVLLRADGTSSAIFFSKGFESARLRIVRSERCDDVALICRDDGSLSRSLRASSSPVGLELQPYGGAALNVADDVVGVRPPIEEGPREFGVSIRLPERHPGRVAIDVLRLPTQTVSASVSTAGGTAYLEQNRTQIVLGRDESALFFSGARDPFEIHIRRVVDCDEGEFACGEDGFHYRRLPTAFGGAYLVARAYRAATIDVDEHRLIASPELRGDAGEFGLKLRMSEPGEDRFAVSMTRISSVPVSASVGSATGSKVLTATQRHFVMRGSDELMLFSSSVQPFELSVESVVLCDGERVVCGDDGEVSYPLRASRQAPGVSVRTFAEADVELLPGGRLVVHQAPMDRGEFGVTLNASPGQVRTLVEFELQPVDEVLVRHRTSEGDRYLDSKQNYLVLEQGAELMFYSRSMTSFSAAVESTLCDAGDWRCRTRSEFSAMLPSNVGGARERALALLRWASQGVDYALTPAPTQAFRPDLGELHEVYFRYFDQDLGGGYCGGTADFFRRLLEDHGIVAFTWNFGIVANELTHVTTVVVIEGGFYMLDATFGRYLANPDTGELLDVREYLDGARSELVPVPMSNRRFVGAVSERSSIVRSEKLVDCHVNDAAFTFSCRWPGFGLESYLTDSYPGLVENGLNPGPDAIRELMWKGVFSIGGSTRSTQAMRDFAHALDERGVPFIEIKGMTSPRELLDGTAQ